MMKLFRRNRAAAAVDEYGYALKRFHLAKDGEIEYAQWLHPKEKPKSISQKMIDDLRAFIRPGDLVIDIGAHTGDTSVPMAIAAGPEGCCLALEPNPYVFKILEINASLNTEKGNLVPLNYAATDTDGAFTFQYSDAAFCNGGYLSKIKNKRHGHRFDLEVEGRNLERILDSDYADRLDRLSYIKVDTEGYDRVVLESLLTLLEERRPVVRTEVLGRLVLDEREQLFDLLDSAGYACFLFDEATHAIGEAIAKSDLMRWKHFDILAIPKEKV